MSKQRADVTRAIPTCRRDEGDNKPLIDSSKFESENPSLEIRKSRRLIRSSGFQRDCATEAPASRADDAAADRSATDQCQAAAPAAAEAGHSLRPALSIVRVGNR